MFNQFASLSINFLSSRNIRFGSLFLLALGCGMFRHSQLGEMSVLNAVGFLNSNGEIFEFARSGGLSERVEWSPTVIVCVMFLVGIVGFLLQPLYLRSRPSSQPKSSSSKSSKPLSLKPKSSDQILSHQSTLDSRLSIVLPLIDRLIITPQSVVASTCRSVDAIPEIEFVPRTIENLTKLLVKSTAAMIVLTRSDVTLEAAEIILGIQQLEHSSFDVTMPQRSSTKDQSSYSNGIPSNSSPSLYHFICDTFGLHQPDLKSIVETQHQADNMTSHDCYIVRREALLSIVNLSQWSSADEFCMLAHRDERRVIKTTD